MKKLLFLIPILILILIGVVFYRYYYVFGEGVKNGELNYVVKKGYIFKTYEGKMIQSGIKSTRMSGSIQSNEFTFSIEDEEIAKELMTQGGHLIDLYYREYLHPLPWRGNSEFVVDSFKIRDGNKTPQDREQKAIEESIEIQQERQALPNDNNSAI